jgi:hypothetical protein
MPSGVKLLLVTESYRFEGEDRFAGFVHRFDRFFEAGRGNHGASLPVELIITPTLVPLATVLP